MKKRSIPVIFALFLCLALPQASEAMGFTFLGIPVANIGEHVARAQKLPKRDDYTLPIDGKNRHVDLGIYHKQLSILGIPFLNWGDEEYVVYRKGWFGGTSYVKVDDPVIESINADLGTNLPLKPRLSFWHRWSGKLLVLIPACLIGLAALRDKFRSPRPAAPTQA